jgi:hypothetical protein
MTMKEKRHSTAWLFANSNNIPIACLPHVYMDGRRDRTENHDARVGSLAAALPAATEIRLPQYATQGATEQVRVA